MEVPEALMLILLKSDWSMLGGSTSRQTLVSACENSTVWSVESNFGAMMRSRCPDANIHSSLPEIGQESLATATDPSEVVSELKEKIDLEK